MELVFTNSESKLTSSELLRSEDRNAKSFHEYGSKYLEKYFGFCILS